MASKWLRVMDHTALPTPTPQVCLNSPFTPLHPCTGPSPIWKVKTFLLPPASLVPAWTCLQPPEPLGRVEREEQSPLLALWPLGLSLLTGCAHCPTQGQPGSRGSAGTARGNRARGTAMRASAGGCAEAPPHRLLHPTGCWRTVGPSVWQGCQGLRAEVLPCTWHRPTSQAVVVNPHLERCPTLACPGRSWRHLEARGRPSHRLRGPHRSSDK